MIKVSYSQENDIITTLEVKGHANSAEYGNDLICAAVSSILFGLFNAIDSIDPSISLEELGNKMVIKNHGGNQKVNDYLELAMIQLKTIEESYHQYISILRKEQSWSLF